MLFPVLTLVEVVLLLPPPWPPLAMLLLLPPLPPVPSRCPCERRQSAGERVALAWPGGYYRRRKAEPEEA